MKRQRRFGFGFLQVQTVLRLFQQLEVWGLLHQPHIFVAAQFDVPLLEAAGSDEPHQEP